MIELTLEGNPISKKRPRLSRRCVYDPQSTEKNKIRSDLKIQMLSKRILKPLEGPVCVETTFGMPTPKSWPKKRLKNIFDKITPHTSKPDVDNLAKWVLDLLNGIAFVDDAQVTRLSAKKVYTKEPCTKILIYPWEGCMVTEHAKLIHHDINNEDLLYLIKKANRLGKSGREIADVHQIHDDEGTHVLFEVEEMHYRRAG